MMPGFTAAFNFLYTLGFHLTFCLNILLIILTSLNGQPWSTWYLGLLFIGQTYVVVIRIISSPVARHVGIQLRTDEALHTFAYQVLPILPRRILQPPEYAVSRRDLLVVDILFVDPGLPGYRAPGINEDAQGAPPPYMRNRIGYVDDPHIMVDVAPPTPPGSPPRHIPPQRPRALIHATLMPFFVA